MVEVSPTLAFWYDVTDAFEARLAAARRALGAVLMDVSAISLE